MEINCFNFIFGASDWPQPSLSRTAVRCPLSVVHCPVLHFMMHVPAKYWCLPSAPSRRRCCQPDSSKVATLNLPRPPPPPLLPLCEKSPSKNRAAAFISCQFAVGLVPVCFVFVFSVFFFFLFSFFYSCLDIFGQTLLASYYICFVLLGSLLKKILGSRLHSGASRRCKK